MRRSKVEGVRLYVRYIQSRNDLINDFVLVDTTKLQFSKYSYYIYLPSILKFSDVAKIQKKDKNLLVRFVDSENEATSKLQHFNNDYKILFLPKELVLELGWEKGERILIFVNIAKRQLLLVNAREIELEWGEKE